MSGLFRFFARLDWVLLGACLFLVGIGCVGLYSTSLADASAVTTGAETSSILFGAFGSFWRQLMFIGVGLGLVFVLALMNHGIMAVAAKYLYFLAIFILIAVLLFGKTIRGTTGWFSIGGFGIQPVELVKVLLVIVLAYFFATRDRYQEGIKPIVQSGALVAVLAGLVMLQPDFGSAVLLLIVWYGLLVISGTRARYLIAIAAAAIALAVVSWFFILKPYQKDRIMVFWDPSRDPLGRGYNVTQSVIAIGSGGVFGKGIGYGSQSQLRFLPERQTDFIFAVLAEELGFVGIVVVLGLFVVVMFRMYRIASTSDDTFTVYMISGFALAIALEAFINIGSNVRLLPVTGVTLPFVSYGGSSLLAKCIMLGIAESAAARRHVHNMR